MELTTNLTTEKARRDYGLVCQARDRGDEQAYATLMQIYREPLYAMLLRMTNNPTEADDLTIETFSKAFCQLHLYTPTNAFSTWLFSIASNNFIDFVRKQRMRTVSLSDMTTSNEDEVYEYPMPSNDPNPEEVLMTEQRAEALRHFVSLLKPRYRNLIEMRYFQEMSYEEIANQLQIPLGTVKIRLMRARNLLSEILKGNKSNI